MTYLAMYSRNPRRMTALTVSLRSAAFTFAAFHRLSSTRTARARSMLNIAARVPSDLERSARLAQDIPLAGPAAAVLVKVVSPEVVRPALLAGLGAISAGCHGPEGSHCTYICQYVDGGRSA